MANHVPSEETALLVPQKPADAHAALYSRFSPARKRVILALVSCAGIVPLLVTGSFVPAIPQLVIDMHSTPSVISLTINIAMFSVAFGNLVWASYSGFYGRRPIYLYSLPTLCIGSIGVATSTSITQLLAWRVLQAVGCSSGMSVGAAVVGDLYALEERGGAMGIFFGAALIGPAIAPFLGGLSVHFASWRALHMIFALLSVFMFIVMYYLLPETSHPGTRGADHKFGEEKWRWHWLNPLKSLTLLRAPNLLVVTLATTVVLMTDFVMSIPLAYTLGKRYNITNEALVGLLFLPVGIGNIIGAPLAGKLSDMTVVRWRAKRKGVWVPEDRLRASLLGSVLAPASTLACGLLTEFVPGRLGIALNVVALFINGIGVDLALSPASAYNVDVLHSRSAEVMSACNALRSMLMAIMTTAILPSLENFGLVWTNLAATVLGWTGLLMLLVTIRYGDRMRASVNIEWSTARDN
ncbi:major facilitator superfamily domain-containing protein [Fomitopsis serialis]|uniref:major facilitator superfamily domain-containing protein n=1 Tax=Fomitopsis serialis TaxID=139415 RepID=UPI002007F7F8|nr:major facilitator superfamily domain-containing protein [Neoantrodia serialis]XP_047891537.1 major facilitator superfamily domain-containing protein [Neoantrodia serialis]KAH9917966.1 major facilitator superfamily domain-containing protein [Neoantrodia serialis]KAH9922674.1 major facilitator superfamily domain-containing protein [Neoantrodia serialis]